MGPGASITTILWLAFAIAFAFGAITARTQFCTMGAVADIVHSGSWDRMRMWLLAIGVAILGAAALHAAGLIDLDKSVYRVAPFTWLSSLVGGFVFGVGMVLASGCGSKTLVRLGGGSLKALVVFIVLGLTAYMTMRGIFAVFRVSTLERAVLALPGGHDLPALIASASGLDPVLAATVVPLATGGGLVAFALAGHNFRSFDNLLGGFGIGLCVVAAWYVSGHLGYLAEHPDTLEEAFLATNSGNMEALSFVAPQAYTLELLMLWSDSSRKLSFGIVTVLGVVAGSAAWSLATRRFRWESFHDTADTARHLAGAALMGFGGVTAMGCTIGQGISGFSTLAASSILAFLAIVAGAAAAIKFEYWRLMRSD